MKPKRLACENTTASVDLYICMCSASDGAGERRVVGPVTAGSTVKHYMSPHCTVVVTWWFV